MNPSNRPSFIQERNHLSGLESLWTTNEVAEFLHVSAKTVFALRRKKGLPYIQLGRLVRFFPEEIRKYHDDGRRRSSHRLRPIARKRPSAMNPNIRLPAGSYLDDPVTKLEVIRICEWISRGPACQRALRSDLVLLCLCQYVLPCKHASAAWCAREHGVSRQRASYLQRDFVRRFDNYPRPWNLHASPHKLTRPDSTPNSSTKRGPHPPRPPSRVNDKKEKPE